MALVAEALGAFALGIEASAAVSAAPSIVGVAGAVAAVDGADGDLERTMAATKLAALSLCCGGVAASPVAAAAAAAAAAHDGDAGVVADDDWAPPAQARGPVLADA